ncbi:hypothetical protein [Micromonospora sp. CB01531]|uniref:hypothetical protein n=1 Tax=Micromonospora sp. CB01531 TaxID=1718947 RepID=UPI0013015A41|nr:hypothetical protein [Micromonospora sp. CB01531]
MDEPVDPATVYEVAGKVLDHHAAGGTCQSCGPDDSPETQWALEQRAKHLARRQPCRR